MRGDRYDEFNQDEPLKRLSRGEIITAICCTHGLMATFAGIVYVVVCEAIKAL
jgi:hypothetical protein